MVKYLQLNGTTSDYIRFWDFNTKQIVDAIEITLLISSVQPSTNPFVLDARTGLANGFFSQSGTNLGSGWVELYKNGVLHTDRRIDDRDVKVTLKIVASADFSDDINIFSNTGNGNNLKGDIYDIKLFKDGSIVSHIDTSTGTVQDQSGNGNHATLTGGTWLDDGAGGGTTPITHDIILSALGKGSAALSMSKTIQSLISMSGSSAVVVNANKVLSSILAATGSGSVSISLDGSQLLQLSMSGKGSALISMTKVQTERVQMSGSSDISLLAALRSNISMSMAGKSNLVFFFGENGEVTGIVELRGSKVVNVYLVGSKDMEVQLIGKQVKTVHLRGVR